MNPNDPMEETIFEAARQLGDPEKQAAYLDSACGKDEALRQRIEQLLRAGRTAKDFFQRQAAILPLALSQTVPGGPITEGAGSIIGRYKLLQKIGEGGCGVVYMAEQEEPVRRRVALKVIKLGMDTKEVIARFDAERQALALMDHPNIAKVLDAGSTDTGRPYFVMELVRGVKVTDFCDDDRLSTEERLKLFIQVCQAIQHAHQKGVIHRDIKPSNILVTINDGAPVPKVIDFGIAKATAGRLTDQTLFTAFQQFIGTPAYMSPEQAVMTSLDIDTRSDIYSLGVLLYELLTGRTPFDQKELLAAGLDEMRRTIREQEPPRPSTRLSTMAAQALRTTAKHRHTDAPKLIHLLKGDLDWIVMKALEKERARRYETANGLASDIQRHLSNEPVNARPPSTAYRFQKLVRRNKLAFAAVGAVAAALLIGLGFSTWLLFKEKAARDRALAAEKAQRQSRERAETEAARSQQVAQFLKRMLKGVGPSRALGRDTTMLREILDETAERVGAELSNQPEVEVDLRLTLARIYRDIGLYSQMEAMARQSLQLARSRLGETNANVAGSLAALGEALMGLRQLEEAEKVSREALAMWQTLLGNENLRVAIVMAHLGTVLRDREKLADAETLLRDALAMMHRLKANEEEDVAYAMVSLANVLKAQSKFSDAEAIDREALKMEVKLLGHDHPHVATLLNNLANVLYQQDKLVDAEATHREALEIHRKIYGNEHPRTVGSIYNLANTLYDQGKLDQAETLYCEALTVVRKKSVQDPSHESAQLATVAHHLADLLRKRKAFPDAQALAEEAVALYQRHADWPAQERDHASEVLRRILADQADSSGLKK